MARYKEQWESFRDDTVTGIKDTEQGWSIPLADGNRHYREYLDWVAEGGVTDPAYTFAERQARAIASLPGILHQKLQQDISYDGDTIRADQAESNGIHNRAFARGAGTALRVFRTDGTVKTVAVPQVQGLLTALADRDDTALDAYETAIAAITAASDWAAVEAALVAFEAA